MKKLNNQPDAQLTEKVVLTFHDWLKVCAETYPPFGKGIKNIRLANDILTSIEQRGEVLEFENEPFASLYKAVQDFDSDPKYNKQLRPYYEEVERANTEKCK